MTVTTRQAAIDLMPQLRDILGMPRDYDLPRLYRITFTAYDEEPGWTVTAMLRNDGKTDLQQWEALQAWARGVTPTLDDASPSSLTPSGFYRKAAVTVVVAEVTVEIWAHLDGEFTPPAPAPVHVDGSFAAWLLGGEPE